MLASIVYTSICSDISSASSILIPRYRTGLGSCIQTDDRNRCWLIGHQRSVPVEVLRWQVSDEDPKPTLAKVLTRRFSVPGHPWQRTSELLVGTRKTNRHSQHESRVALRVRKIHIFGCDCTPGHSRIALLDDTPDHARRT